MYSNKFTINKNWMDNMRTMFAIIILGFLITGCSTTYVVSSSSEDTSIDEFNNFVKGRMAEIILKDTLVIKATDVYLSADSLFWIEPESILKSSVVKSDVRKVILTENILGGLEGWGLGMLSGGIAGLVTTWAIWGGVGGYWYLILPATGIALGALVGITTGLIIGHTYEFRILNY